MIFKASTSFDKPPLLEVNDYVGYIRKDVEESTDTDGRTIYTYQEAELSIPEFNSYVARLSAENAAKSEVTEANVSAVMDAIVDLYDMISEMGGTE